MQGDANQLIPELSQWNNGAGIDVATWIGCVGRYDHAIGYASIFWPEFVMHDGCILLGTPDPAGEGVSRAAGQGRASGGRFGGVAGMHDHRVSGEG